jgi:hypothetical protein
MVAVWCPEDEVLGNPAKRASGNRAAFPDGIMQADPQASYSWLIGQADGFGPMGLKPETCYTVVEA